MVACEPGTQSRGSGLISVLIAPFPSFLFCFLDLILCSEAGLGLHPSSFCAATKLHPLLLLNLLFLLNVCILFWLLSLYQQSTWVRSPLPLHPDCLIFLCILGNVPVLTHVYHTTSLHLFKISIIGSFPRGHRGTASLFIMLAAD